jgi:glycerol-3-phosphate cytidylyltransferase
MKVGITFGVFDLLHAGHVQMLEEAKTQCDYLIVGLHCTPTLENPNRLTPTQTVVERFIQLEGCRFVDEIIPYQTEAELELLLQELNVNIRIVGSEYRDQAFTGKTYCLKNGIKIFYNSRTNRYTSAGLRKTVAQKEAEKIDKNYKTN